MIIRLFMDYSIDQKEKKKIHVDLDIFWEAEKRGASIREWASTIGNSGD